MPHYSDGTEAKIGDIVRGKPYNTPREVVGEVISVTPGTESCNCQVAFVDVREATAGELTASQELGLHYLVAICHPSGDAKPLRIVPRTDYGETKAFTKV